MTTTSQTPTDTLREAVARLSLETKVALLTGETMWRLHAIEDIGLRSVTFSDGPVGVRGLGEKPGETSVLFPSPSAISATWNPALAHEVGRAFAVEARAHAVDVVLAPQVNIQRTPVGGRHFECYSEDPFLTSVMGTAVVRGLQDEGVGACIKHYIANDSETDRTSYISAVSPRALREVYLAPFEAAVDAGVWSVMAAYNQADYAGQIAPMTAHGQLVNGLLKDELGFDGVVVSDWVATRTTVPTALGGLDLVMPGPGGPWEQHLVDAVRAGDVPEHVIDDKVERVLRLAQRVGAFAAPERDPRYLGDLSDLVLRAAAQGTVVLKSSDPWDRPAPASVALIGPNVVRPHVLGGGSSTVHPDAIVTPAQGVAQRWPGARVTVARGTDPRALAPAMDLGEVEVILLDEQGRKLSSRSLDVWDGWLRDIPATAHEVELRATVLLEEPGEHILEIGTVGAHRILVDGALVSASDQAVGVEVILDSTINTPTGHAAAVTITEPREVPIVSRHGVIDAEGYGRMIRADLRHRAPGPSGDQEMADAVAAAFGADLVVVVVGTNEEVESEGWDRASLALPGRQDELVERVLDIAPDAVIVVNAGAPVILPWLERARTVLWAWFPGQEAGHALAAVLAGDLEPAGRLPWTLPASEADVPVPNATPIDGRITYDEGIHVGYRGWDRAGATPAAPFGHGLGWTDWSYDRVEVSKATDAEVTLSVTVTNVGHRHGTEVVQAYLAAPSEGPERPVRWLAGFDRVEAAPGESVTATILVERRRFEIWSETANSWEVPPGEYSLRIGRSLTDVRLNAAVQVSEVTEGRRDT